MEYAVIGVVSAVIAAWFIATFNRLVRDRNRAREAWSGIDVQLKRRHNVVPNLVRTVQGYARHEQDLFDKVTARRTACMRTATARDAGDAENMLSGALRSLLAVVEAYPNLKANDSFLQLQSDLSRVEDQIQLARRYYNGCVRDYNIRVESFPGMAVAALTGFRSEEFFEIEYATERAVPDVAM